VRSGWSERAGIVSPTVRPRVIGYRSLLRADLPSGGRLGIYGFGGSAHITAQVALAQGAEVHVMTRGTAARTLAEGALRAEAAPSSKSRPRWLWMP
jgi:propanol-preferring alcohol dehydrogenase